MEQTSLIATTGKSFYRIGWRKIDAGHNGVANEYFQNSAGKQH